MLIENIRYNKNMANDQFVFLVMQAETLTSIEKRLNGYTNGSVTWVIPGTNSFGKLSKTGGQLFAARKKYHGYENLTFMTYWLNRG